MVQPEEDAAIGSGRAWLVIVVAGALANPNVWVPLMRLVRGAGIPPVSWQSANVISWTVILLGVLTWAAGRYPRWRTGLFLYVVVLLTLAGAELALRIIRPPAALILDFGYPRGLLVPDREVGRRYAPGFEGRFTYLMYGRIPIRTNSMGFRDTEPDPDALRRVIVLGDSITFGSGVREGDRYTDVLERGLTARLGGTVDVQSWGINGTETSHHRALYRRDGALLPHDLVVIGFCLNDVVPVSIESLYRKTVRKAGRAGGIADLLGRRGLSLHYLFLVRLSARSIGAAAARAGLAGPTEAAQHRERYEAFLREAWSREENRVVLTEELRAIRDAAHQNGARLALVAFPYCFQFASRDFGPQRILAELLTPLEIPMVDLREPFAAAMASEPVYLAGDDCHPDERGHRVAAGALLPLAEALLTD